MSLLKKRLLVNGILGTLGIILMILPVILLIRFEFDDEGNNTLSSNADFIIIGLSMLSLFIGLLMIMFPGIKAIEMLQNYIPNSEFFMAYGPKVYNKIRLIGDFMFLFMILSFVFIFVFKDAIFITLTGVFFILFSLVISFAYVLRNRYFKLKSGEIKRQFKCCPKCNNEIPSKTLYCIHCNKIYTMLNRGSRH